MTIRRMCVVLEGFLLLCSCITFMRMKSIAEFKWMKMLMQLELMHSVFPLILFLLAQV